MDPRRPTMTIRRPFVLRSRAQGIILLSPPTMMICVDRREAGSFVNTSARHSSAPSIPARRSNLTPGKSNAKR